MNSTYMWVELILFYCCARLQDGKFTVETNEHGTTELIYDGARLTARSDKVHSILRRLHIKPLTREHIGERSLYRLVSLLI